MKLGTIIYRRLHTISIALSFTLVNLGACVPTKNNVSHMAFQHKNISGTFSTVDFEKTKHFVLENGDRKTYRNFDGGNPHYNFGQFDVFFGADIGQGNITNDPVKSDFNELVIMTNDRIRYYTLLIVRKGDIQNQKKLVTEGMEEGQVYLLGSQAIELEELENGLKKYLQALKKKAM